ncbi:MAG: radical SAM protein [Nitrospina sp.]|nr:radical SAM protein [Nitrospina sp.]
MSNPNGIKLELQKLEKSTILLGRRSMPLQLVLFVTSRCNMRCDHCFYLDEINDSSRTELSLDQIESLAKELGGLHWIALSGGEPYLRKDLVEIFKAFYKYSRPNIMSHVTNGYYPDRISEMTRKMAEACPKSKNLVIFSLDGLKETHEQIRHSPGSFEKVRESIESVQKHQSDYPNLETGVVITAQENNREELIPLIEYIESKLIPDGIYINLQRDHTQPSNVLVDPLTLKNYQEAVAFYEDLRNKKHLKKSKILDRLLDGKNKLQKRMIAKIAEENSYQLPCLAGKVSVVVDELGNVYACELLKDPMGNLTNQSFKEIWFGEKSVSLSNSITENKCYCTHECAMSSSLLFNPPKLLHSMVAGMLG